MKKNKVNSHRLNQIAPVLQEQIMINLKISTRIKLEIFARENGVTMSWIIRSLLQTYVRNNKIPPETKRPRHLPCRTIRFNVCFYNNKNELMTWVRSGGREFGPVIRYILEMWEEGKLDADVENLRTIKEHYNTIFIGKSFYSKKEGYGFQFQFKVQVFQEKDYWLKNWTRNILLMNRGINNRIHSLFKVENNFA